LFSVAGLVVLFCTLVLVAVLTWGAGRINARETFTDANAPAGPEPKQPVPHA
jgi:Na+-transporting methylmalonyl-CoA/oxaloacetate decarboxylase gamma subunit